MWAAVAVGAIAHHLHLVFGRVDRQSSRHCDRLQDRGVRFELVLARLGHLPQHIHVVTVHFLDGDRHGGAFFELFQARGETFSKLVCRHSSCFHISDQRDGDHPIRPHDDRPREILVAPHHYIEHVLRPNQELLGGSIDFVEHLLRKASTRHCRRQHREHDEDATRAFCHLHVTFPHGMRHGTNTVVSDGTTTVLRAAIPPPSTTRLPPPSDCSTSWASDALLSRFSYGDPVTWAPRYYRRSAPAHYPLQDWAGTGRLTLPSPGPRTCLGQSQAHDCPRHRQRR